MPQDDIPTALAMLRQREPAYRKYEAYFDGRHPLQFATQKFHQTFGSLFSELAVNHCPAVVNAVADRLSITGFSVQGRPDVPAGKQREADAGDRAWELWQANRMDARAGQLHREAVLKGDAYLIVWPNAAGEVRLYPQHAENCCVYYDEEEPGRVLWGAKAWVAQGSRLRLNLYYPDGIEKWVTRQSAESLPEKAGAFVEYETGPLPNPWGVVPLFHFASDPGISGYGRSELVPAIPLQDALNKAVADMLVGMEFVAFPQRWVTGLLPETDPVTGKPIPPFRVGVDKLWVTEGVDVKFGEFPQASLTGHLQVQDSFRMEIARVTGTPTHYMMLLSDPPSGEALKTLEARLVKKVLDRHIVLGDSWEAALALALRMANQSAEADPGLVTEWEDPNPRSETEKAATLTALTAAGASLYAAAKVAGYTEAEAEELVKTTEAGFRERFAAQAQQRRQALRGAGAV